MLLCLASCFLYFVFLFFRFFYLFFLHQFMFIFFVSLRLCSRHMLLSASTYFIVRVLSACVSFTLPHLGILLFSYSCRIFLVAPFCLVAFLLCSRTRYTSTWFVYVDSLAFGFCPSHCLWPHNLYRSRMKNQEGHWGYRWCRWIETTVSCEDNNNNNNNNNRNRYISIQHFFIFATSYTHDYAWYW